MLPRATRHATLVGLAAFSGSLCGWKLVPAKWRPLVLSTSPHQGASQTQAVGQKEHVGTDE